MRVLVTGAGGFVGGHLLEFLSSKGHEIFATSSRPGRVGAQTIHELDVTDTASVKNIVKTFEPNTVAHLAARASVPLSWVEPGPTINVNVIGAVNILDALKERLGTRVLLVGSAQQYMSSSGHLKESGAQDPRSPYAVTKLAQEMLGLLYQTELGANVVMTRSFNHIGPGQSETYVVGSFASQLAAIGRKGGGTLRAGRLDSIRDFLDVRDVVSAYGVLLERGLSGEVYNVASGKGFSIKDIAEMMIRVAGLEGSVELMGDQVDTSRQQGDPDCLIGDNTKILGLGWMPTIPLERSLADALEWHRREQEVTSK